MSRLLYLSPIVLALIGGPVAYFLLLKVPWVRNTAWPNILILLVAVAWALIHLQHEYSAWTIAALGLTLGIAVGFIYLRFGLASLPEAHPRVAVGSVAPDFSLQNSSGKEVTLSSLREKSNVVLIFFRGVW